MVGFGFKQAWLAIREVDPATVIATLGLRDLGEAPWRDGIDLAYLTDNRVAVTPPLPGAGGARWVLAVGKWLLRPGAPTDVAGISAALDTEVQFFATHRVMELHRWERARAGNLVRGFEYVGETGEVNLWHGEPDPAELAAGLPAAIGEEVDVLVDEADVLRVAEAWSVDPASLDGAAAPGPLRLAATD
ncbi:hypothetical protein JQS43_20875 [Natronosporangium hydrolyticum]|uniref:Uncharacterized protein n=2 Tax=Natronosporangium hydrolyticum TaxID=2811111 RepID=A0A895YTU8_9ACTN|nr:hypothetical protein JQS43_20875 [Natronosporangium hydrolyticum]